MRPSGPRRNPAAALLGGLACGALWFLFATTILDVVRPGATVVPALAVAAVMGLAAAAFCWRPGTSREVWGRVALTVGLHALAMPVAAAISFGATGIWPPPETADLGLSVDVWETTYLHLLTGPDPVFTWISGTGARPTLQALPDDLRQQFVTEYKRLLRDAYPRGAHGTMLPFRRIFAVAHR